MGAEMQKKRVGGGVWGTDGSELVGSRGCPGKWRPRGLTFLRKKGGNTDYNGDFH